MAEIDQPVALAEPRQRGVAGLPTPVRPDLLGERAHRAPERVVQLGSSPRPCGGRRRRRPPHAEASPAGGADRPSPWRESDRESLRRALPPAPCASPGFARSPDARPPGTGASVAPVPPRRLLLPIAVECQPSDGCAPVDPHQDRHSPPVADAPRAAQIPMAATARVTVRRTARPGAPRLIAAPGCRSRGCACASLRPYPRVGQGDRRLLRDVHHVLGELREVEAGEVDALDLRDRQPPAVAPADAELRAALLLQDAPSFEPNTHQARERRMQMPKKVRFEQYLPR